MKNSAIRLFMCFCFLVSVSFSQNIKAEKKLTRCGSDEYNRELLKQFPKMMGSEIFEERLKSIMEAYKARKTSGAVKQAVITIPVVIHVLHNGEPIGTGPNISDAQAISQINVLNEDYRKKVGSRGDGGGVDVEVEFCLAKQDPYGCPTSGINRVNIGQDGISATSDNEAISKMNLLKPNSIWDSTLYMNMWSVKFSGVQLLGYAQFPGGGTDTDGVVVDYNYFGSDDDPDVTLYGDFIYGRTMTHEVGHYLGLYHLWGDSCGWTEGDSEDKCCGDDDLVDDTPNSGKPSYGCPTTVPDTCPEPDDDMIENYMDYSSDICFNTFTAGQKTRIQAVLTGLDPNQSRISLASSDKCNLVSGEMNDASVNVVFIDTPACGLEANPIIRITNWGDNTLSSASINYNVDGGSSSTHNVSGLSLAKGESAEVNVPTLTATIGNHTLNVSVLTVNGNTDQRSCNNSDSSNFIIDQPYSSINKVLLTLTLDDYPNETSWRFKDGSNNLLAQSPIYKNPQDNGKTFDYEFNVITDECYTFTIMDTYGDGLCCDTQGNYILKTNDGIVISTGGDYKFSEITTISTITLGVNTFFVNNKVTIYPNPTNGILNIKLSNVNQLPDTYQVYNILGQSIVHKKIKKASDLTIDTNAISRGMYFIKIIKDNQYITLPFVKN